MEVATISPFQQFQPRSMRFFGIEVNLDESPNMLMNPIPTCSSMEFGDYMSTSTSASSCSESEDYQSDNEFQEAAVQTLAFMKQQKNCEIGNLESDLPSMERRPSSLNKSSSTDDCWERSFQELVEFYKRHGHATVTGKKYYSLANWVRKQRSCKKGGKLSSEKVAKLNALGFEWDRTYFFKK